MPKIIVYSCGLCGEKKEKQKIGNEVVISTQQDHFLVQDVCDTCVNAMKELMKERGYCFDCHNTGQVSIRASVEGGEIRDEQTQKCLCKK